MLDRAAIDNGDPKIFDDSLVNGVALAPSASPSTPHLDIALLTKSSIVQALFLNTTGAE